jgi:hypothetical protein
VNGTRWELHFTGLSDGASPTWQSSSASAGAAFTSVEAFDMAPTPDGGWIVTGRAVGAGAERGGLFVVKWRR